MNGFRSKYWPPAALLAAAPEATEHEVQVPGGGDVVKGFRLKNSQRAALLAASAVATASRSLRTDARREARSRRT